MSLKVSTSLDQNGEILEDAPDHGLLERGRTGVVAESWAAIPSSADEVRQILAEEEDLFDRR